MIEINLVPEELRVIEQTPLPRRLSIYGGVTMMALVLVCYLILMINVTPEVKKQAKHAFENMVGKEMEATRYDELTVQKTELEGRMETVNELKKGRSIIWAIERCCSRSSQVDHFDDHIFAHCYVQCLLCLNRKPKSSAVFQHGSRDTKE